MCFSNGICPFSRSHSYPEVHSRVWWQDDEFRASYFDFGVLLLGDDDGNKITATKEEQRDINREVLRLWLSRKGRQPVTWATLVSVLQDIGLVKLAEDI
jgi:hypothetical protein